MKISAQTRLLVLALDVGRDVFIRVLAKTGLESAASR